jgi:hypothetical protein
MLTGETANETGIRQPSWQPSCLAKITPMSWRRP